MASHSFRIDSSLSPADAYALTIDLEKVSQWDAGVLSSTRLDDNTDGRAQFDVSVTGFDGQPSSVVYTITDSDEPDRFVMVGENDVFRAVDTLVFEAAEHGCVLDYHGTLELLGNNPPLTPTQLESMFPKIAKVAETGLTSFLNP